MERAFRELFEYLETQGYAWRALNPERSKKLRGSAEIERQAGRPLPLIYQDPLTLFFGLGVGEGGPSGAAGPESFPAAFPIRLATEVLSATRGLRPAVSRVRDRFVVHDHWDARDHADSGARRDLVYLSEETFALLDRVPDCTGLRVLDLGSGAGALSLALSATAREVVGLELSARAVEWARASAAAQGILNVRFECVRIPDAIPEKSSSMVADPRVGSSVRPSVRPSVLSPGGAFDLVVFNPPMAIPDSSSSYPHPRPHRDGGALGCELPALFLDYAWTHLRTGGEACFLATSPVIGGHSIFHERISRDRRWRASDAAPAGSAVSRGERLNSHFNQSIARKAGYAELGIERVELWCFKLRKI